MRQSIRQGAWIARTGIFACEAKGKGMDEKLKNRVVGNGDNFAGNFIAKNIHICIYTNLYFLTTKRWFE